MVRLPWHFSKLAVVGSTEALLLDARRFISVKHIS